MLLIQSQFKAKEAADVTETVGRLSPSSGDVRAAETAGSGTSRHEATRGWGGNPELTVASSDVGCNICRVETGR
ncbi:hypothetical protein CRENBAI_003242 [Crenichthys baileyi]|uniref:Uncharacterized protein n=1 Tax=Crenichthys baileyi TaxID=28760 RepID=A0AAV9SF19_9TELE